MYGCSIEPSAHSLLARWPTRTQPVKAQKASRIHLEFVQLSTLVNHAPVHVFQYVSWELHTFLCKTYLFDWCLYCCICSWVAFVVWRLNCASNTMEMPRSNKMATVPTAPMVPTVPPKCCAAAPAIDQSSAWLKVRPAHTSNSWWKDRFEMSRSKVSGQQM